MVDNPLLEQVMLLDEYVSPQIVALLQERITEATLPTSIA